VTWSVDEGVSASTYKSPDGRPARRIFIRNCLIAEGLSNATHDKGEHSKGTLVLDETQNVAITGCSTRATPSGIQSSNSTLRESS